MKAKAALTLTLAAAFAGCGGEADDPLPVPAGAGARWDALVTALPERVDPDAAGACARGAPGCIDAVVAEMHSRTDALARVCHHAAPFALMYQRVTEGVAASPAQSAYLNHLDALFATLYFDAIDSWRAGETGSVPEAWAVSFAAAAERRVSALGDILLGMNAHISRDLPFALERAGIRTPSGRSARPAFDSVNGVLGEIQEPMLREQGRQFDPGVPETTLPALAVGGGTFAELMARWRTEAFANGERLLAVSGEDRERVAAEIEAAAAGRGRLIEALTSNLVLGPGADEREQYCESRLSGD